MQLLHALLLHLSDQEPTLRQVRMDRAILTIRAQDQPTIAQEGEATLPTRRLSRRTRWLIQLAVAASLLIVIANAIRVSSSNAAFAALEQVVQAIDRSADRTYQISVEPSDAPVAREPRQLAYEAAGQPPEDGRSGLDGGILYVRDGNQFVLYRSTLSGRPLINGSNGHENWLVRPNGAVLLSNDPNTFRVPMPESMASVPFVDIRTSLNNLRRGYRLQELPEEPILNDNPMRWRHLRAVKIDPVTKGPKSVSIWFDPTTHLICQLRFEQIHLQGRPEPRRMTIALISREPLPANWFGHDSHHPADAPVERVYR